MSNRHDSQARDAAGANAKLLLAALQHREGAIEMMFSVQTWPDPSAWGLFLADLARHIGDAYEQAQGLPAARTVARVLELFQKEMAHPTDQTRGHLHHRGDPCDQN
jgi:hypothetical protein